jgi:hypothetical protein
VGAAPRCPEGEATDDFNAEMLYQGDHEKTGFAICESLAVEGKE